LLASSARTSEFLRREVPGCEHGRLVAFGTQIGVPETRRIEGDYVLEADDLRGPTQFEDAIAAGAYPIDIHPATGGELHYEGLSEDHAHQIPFRSLIPTSLDNRSSPVGAFRRHMLRWLRSG
jgi:hypothetical protein